MPAITQLASDKMTYQAFLIPPQHLVTSLKALQTRSFPETIISGLFPAGSFQWNDFISNT